MLLAPPLDRSISQTVTTLQLLWQRSHTSPPLPSSVGGDEHCHRHNGLGRGDACRIPRRTSGGEARSVGPSDGNFVSGHRLRQTRRPVRDDPLSRNHAVSTAARRSVLADGRPIVEPNPLDLSTHPRFVTRDRARWSGSRSLESRPGPRRARTGFDRFYRHCIRYSDVSHIVHFVLIAIAHPTTPSPVTSDYICHSYRFWDENHLILLI